VARFEEAMATIRALWDSGGELVCRESAFFPLHNAGVRPAPLPPREMARNLDRGPRSADAERRLAATGRRLACRPISSDHVSTNNV